MKKNIGFSEEEKNQMRKEAIIGYIESYEDLKQSKRKKIIMTILIIVIIILLIKIFMGNIELTSRFSRFESEARYYKVTINNKQLIASYNAHKRVPIIPYLIYSNSYYTGYSSANSKEQITNNDKYILNIKSYSCYYNDEQIECESSRRDKRENNDEEYIKLQIGNYNTRKTIYEGKYINDITSYIKDKGEYILCITSIYDNVDTKIYVIYDND